MREILFRGKRSDNGEWVKGDLRHGGYYTSDPGVYIVCPFAGTIINYPIYPATVGQFTGMVDRNGDRIFEGDICQIKNHRLITDTPFVVEWEDFVYNGWTWRDLDEDGAVDSFTTGAANYCEVIGNIHDNPELIGGDTP